MKKIILILFVFLGGFLAAHPLKTTITNFTYHKESSEVKIKINLFEDDFEGQLSIIHNKKIDLDNPSKKNNQLITSYILKNLKVKINKKNYPLQFIKYTVIEDPNNKIISVELIIESITIQPEDTLTMTNKILFDAEEKQSNLVRIDQFNNNKCRNLEFDLRHPVNIYLFRRG